ncbi:MAG: hypothetical protein Q7S84_03750 [bacterium]|nr:hypothetical protein [bacterium]
MNSKRGRDAPSGNVAAPTPEDFKGSSVQRHVLAQASKEPLTVIPLAIGTVCVLAGVVLVAPAALIAGLLSGGVSAGSFIWHYFIKGERVAEEYVQELRTRRDEAQRQSIRDFARECENAGFDEGAKEAGELKEAYYRLRDFLIGDSVEGKSTESGQYYFLLAENTFQHGIELLRQAMNTFRALQKMDTHSLEEERDTWVAELAKLEKSKQKKESELTNLRTKIESHQKRLEVFSQQEEYIQELMARCEVCESALDTSYMQLTRLITSTGKVSLAEKTDALTELERAVQAAKKVEEKLRSTSGAMTREEEAVYERAGQKN